LIVADERIKAGNRNIRYHREMKARISRGDALRLLILERRVFRQ
jgi:hypothetical protein